MGLILQSLKSKTVWFSITLAALSVLQGYIGFLPVSQVAQAAIGVFVSSCYVVLRAITTMSINEK
jgi:uncharacterized membrane protein YobD (UPF0266 family)